MHVKVLVVLAVGLCSVILPSGYALRERSGEAEGIWSKCRDRSERTVYNCGQPYKSLSGELPGLSVEEVDKLFHDTLKGWVRTKHIQCLVSPTCYINNKTGTRIEFERVLFSGPDASVWVHEVRWLNDVEMVAFKATDRFREHPEEPSIIPPPLEPGPVSSGGCWAQPYGTKW